MRKWFRMSIAIMLALMLVSPAGASWVGDLQSAGVDSTSKTWAWNSGYNLKLKSGYFDLYEMSAPAAPAANFGRLYVKDVGGVTSLFFKTYAGTDTNLLTAGSGGTLDQAYDQGGAGAGRAITVDSGAVALTNNAANNNGLLTVTKAPVGAQSGDLVTITAGPTATGAALVFANSGSGNDITGSGSTWGVTKAGVATFTGLSFTGAFSASGGIANLNVNSNYATNINTGTSNAAVSIGGGVGTVAVNSNTWDISTAGAVSGVTTLSMSDDLTMANGKGVKSSVTTGQTVGVYGYDNDGAAYVAGLVVTNGNTPATLLGNSGGTTEITSSDWAISTAGAMTGIGAITMDGALTVNNATVTLYSNEAITFGHATNGAADDLTIALTGATDSSIKLVSSGTGADAISLQTSVGGIYVDAPAAQDVSVAGGQVTLTSKDDAASAIALTANIGTSETIIVTNVLGTSESAITLLASAGGVNIDAAAAKDLDLAGGQIKLVSKDNAAGAISLTANIGTSETITVTNTLGTSESAITLLSSAGGVNVDAAAAKDLDLAGGQVLISSKDNVASAVAITTNAGSSETVVVTNTQGTDAAAINLTATAGGITQAVASGKAITLNGTTNFKVGANIASPGGAELTLGDGTYFQITGTNNITSIAVASSTAGRMVILRFADVLTFTDGNNLKLAGNFTTSADDVITLICDGSNWYEMSRSVN